jgi:hypothetical protein
LKTSKLWVGLALAAAVSGGSKGASAQTYDLTFLGIDLVTPYSVLSTDNLRMGMFQWFGRYYVGVVDDVTCQTYFALRNGAVMENGLTGNSRVQLGGPQGPPGVSTDRFFVQSPSAPSVGGGGTFCPSAPALSPLNHAGWTFEILGQAGHDELWAGYQGLTYMYGGADYDHISSQGSLGIAFGGSGKDTLFSHFIGAQLYGGDDGDLIADSHTPLVYGEWYYGEAGNDCIWDPDSFTAIDCGPGDDRRGGAAGTAVWCEGTVSSYGACLDYYSNN